MNSLICRQLRPNKLVRYSSSVITNADGPMSLTRKFTGLCLGTVSGNFVCHGLYKFHVDYHKDVFPYTDIVPFLNDYGSYIIGGMLFPIAFCVIATRSNKPALFFVLVLLVCLITQFFVDEQTRKKYTQFMNIGSTQINVITEHK